MNEEAQIAARRAFIKRAAALAATAPAAALMLSASGKIALAGGSTVPIGPYGECPPGTIRDGDQCFIDEAQIP